MSTTTPVPAVSTRDVCKKVPSWTDHRRQPFPCHHVRLPGLSGMTAPTGTLVGGVVAKTGDLVEGPSDLQNCVRCRKPMKMELGEPVGGISEAVVLTLKCPSCGVTKKIKRARSPVQVRN
jgi:hypothetical protein